MKRPDLFLMAKQPQPGLAKTRLAQVCGAQGAAEIAAALIRETVSLAASYWPGEVFLSVAPDAGHPLFQALAAEFSIHLVGQGEGDLGARMLRLLGEGIARRGAAAVMGCDVPHCKWSTIEQAYEALARGRNAIGPTLDGGYYFLGLQQATSSLFEGIEWGGNQVLRQTRALALQAGIEFETLETLRDVDTWEDLLSVALHYPPLQPFATRSLRAGLPDGKGS